MVTNVNPQGQIRGRAGPRVDLQINNRKFFVSKWQAIGGTPSSLTGEPVALAGGWYMDTPNGGRLYQPKEFQKPFHVYGSIGERYKQLGGPTSYLGWPVADEEAFAEGGRWNRFTGGAIYWWQDTGAIDLRGVTVSYAGFHCFGETDWDGVPPKSDEPAFHLGVIPVGGEAFLVNTPVTEGVDGGGTYPSDLLLYQSGNPYGMAVTVLLVEHSDIPAWLPGAIVEVIKKVGVALAAYVGAGAAAPLIEQKVEEHKPEMRTAIERTLVENVRIVGETQLIAGPKTLVTLAKAPLKDMGGLRWSIESPLIEGLGASYKMYLRVQALQ